MDIIFFLLLLLFPCSSMADGPSANSSIFDSGKDICASLVLHEFDSSPAHSPCSSKNKSSGIFWLGASTNVSKAQLLSRHLRIGIPVKNGFSEFMKVDYDGSGNHVASGFPVDVFIAVIKTLPYNVTYEFIPFKGNGDAPGYYDDLIYQVYLKKYDAVVGDTAITAARSYRTEFTYQYMDAGVTMIVPTQDDDTLSPWWFMKPLTTTLWLTTLAFAVLKGILVWFFEHEINKEFQGSPSEVIGKMLSFTFSTFFFAAHEKLESNYSRFIVNLWTFLVFVLVTAYAANLTSMLTVEKLQPTITDVASLIRNGDFIGYQSGSFVFDLLKSIGFHESKLRPYSKVEQYADALEQGSSNGGVSAIMDEIPYIRVFLKNHCRKYTMVGRIYRTGGFGFVFPRGSAMVADISRAVVNFSEGEKMYGLEKKWFGDQTSCPDAGSPISNKRLPLYSLRAIYILTGVASATALTIYFIRCIYKPKRLQQGSNSSRIIPVPEAVIELGANQGPDQIHYSPIQVNENKSENKSDLENGESNDKVGHNDFSMDAPPSARLEDTIALGS